MCDANGDATQNTRGWKKGGRYGMTAEMLVNERGKFVKEREMQNASARRTRSRERSSFDFAWVWMEQK